MRRMLDPKELGELGGGGGEGNFKQLYVHAIRIYQNYTNIYVQLTLDNNEPIDNLQKLINALKIYLNGTAGQSVTCSGSTKDSEAIVGLYYNNDFIISYITLKYDSNKTHIVSSTNNLSESWEITDTITIPRKTA